MIRVIEDKCIGCNACIRTCPVVTANRYDGTRSADIAGNIREISNLTEEISNSVVRLTETE